MDSPVAKWRCRIFGHKRRRDKVWHDGIDYRAPCLACGVALVRYGDGHWRPPGRTAAASPPGPER